MRRLGSEIVAFAAGLAMFSAGTVLAADETTAPNAPARMEMTDDGPILVASSTGMTIYINSADANTPGRSQCSNIAQKTQKSNLGEHPVMGAERQKSCAEKWPPYLADAPAQAEDDFAFITRPEGGKQWTWRGHPLYTSVKDHKPGDRNGAAGSYGGGGRRGAFGLVMVPIDIPAGLKLTRRLEGLIFATTTNDRAVYTPHGVRLSKICAGCDQELFQSILAPAVANVSGDWSIVDAGPGRRQYAFKGKPLYAAPESLTDVEIAEAGGWEKVVFRKDPGMPSEIQTHLTLVGDVFTTKAGLTLYTFSCSVGRDAHLPCDDPGDAAGYWVALCGDAKECARRWRPYLASTSAKPIGEWSIVDVAYPMFTDPLGYTYPPDAPRVKAWAYRGSPVYTYYEDKGPSDIWGHTTKGLWGSSFNALQVPGHTSMYE